LRDLTAVTRKSSKKPVVLAPVILTAVRFLILVILCIALVGCKSERNPAKTQEEVAAEALPENIGDKTAPVEIKALKGAKEVKKRIDAQRKEDSKVLKESN
jgi:predicted Holliday junction resolvase-like endonuclease